MAPRAQVYLNLAVALDTSIERGPEDEESTIICSLMAARALALAKLGLFQQANQCAEVNLGICILPRRCCRWSLRP